MSQSEGCACPQGPTLYARRDGAMATCCTPVFDQLRREMEKTAERVSAEQARRLAYAPIYDHPAKLEPMPSFSDWLRSPLSDDEYFASFNRSTVPSRLQGAAVAGMKPAPAPPAPPPPPAPPAANDAAPEENDGAAIRRLFHLADAPGRWSSEAYNWEEAFKCAGLRPQDCRTVLCSEEGENDGDSWLAILWLRDGRFAFLSAGCDYTGWDCQAGGDHHVCAELSDLLLGFVGEQDVKRLQVTMPAWKAAA